MKTALLLIDVQKGFQSIRWPSRNNPQAEEKYACCANVFSSIRSRCYSYLS